MFDLEERSNLARSGVGGVDTKKLNMRMLVRKFQIERCHLVAGTTPRRVKHGHDRRLRGASFGCEEGGVPLGNGPDFDRCGHDEMYRWLVKSRSRILKDLRLELPMSGSRWKRVEVREQQAELVHFRQHLIDCARLVQ